MKKEIEEEKKTMSKEARFKAMEEVVNMLSEKLFMDSDKKMDDDDDSDEEKEEEMHMDLDNDAEKGESLEHKKKVMPGLFKKGK